MRIDYSLLSDKIKRNYMGFKFEYNKIQQEIQQKHHNCENQSLNAKDETVRQITWSSQATLWKPPTQCCSYISLLSKR